MRIRLAGTHKPYKWSEEPKSGGFDSPPLNAREITEYQLYGTRFRSLKRFRIPKQLADSGQVGIPRTAPLVETAPSDVQQQFARTVEGIRLFQVQPSKNCVPWD